MRISRTGHGSYLGLSFNSGAQPFVERNQVSRTASADARADLARTPRPDRAVFVPAFLRRSRHGPPPHQTFPRRFRSYQRCGSRPLGRSFLTTSPNAGSPSNASVWTNVPGPLKAKTRRAYPSNRLIRPPTMGRLGQLGGQDAEQRYGHKASPPEGASRFMAIFNCAGLTRATAGGARIVCSRTALCLVRRRKTNEATAAMRAIIKKTPAIASGPRTGPSLVDNQAPPQGRSCPW